MSGKYLSFFNKINLELKTEKLSASIAYLILILCYPLIIHNSNNKLLTSIMLGAVIYGTYGFTLSAIFSDYTIQLALTEMLWGSFLFLITTYLTNIISNNISIKIKR
tara:strand:+ start:176 stop:496 length:321 start_codon:yes stop_codon:yes gene_type:complete